MALKLELETLDEVPEGVRDFYREADGRYVLDVEGAVPKAKLDEFRENNIQLKQKLETLSQVDVDEYARLRQEAKERERKEAEKRGEYERLLGETREEYEARIKAKEEALAAKESQLRELVRDRELSAALAKEGLKPEAQDLALSYASRFVETREIDGRVRAVVVGPDGKPRLNANGDEMSVSEFVAEFKGSPGGQALFAPEIKTGGGAAGRGSTGGATVRSRADMTPAEKVALIREARERGEPNPGRVLLDLPN